MTSIAALAQEIADAERRMQMSKTGKHRQLGTAATCLHILIQCCDCGATGEGQLRLTECGAIQSIWCPPQWDSLTRWCRGMTAHQCPRCKGKRDANDDVPQKKRGGKKP